MSTPIVVTLAAADLERERPNLARGSVVAVGVTGLPVGAFCDVELVFPSGERLTLPARAVLATEGSTIFAFDGFDRDALHRHLASPIPAPEASATIEERLRGLSVVDQLRIAREGSLSERVVLERLYGKIVWEVLLRNSRLTVPEVARMAKMGALPRPLLELIVANGAWLQNPLVRRALLTNPRLSQEMVQKVLALLPRDELKLVPQAAVYPPAVRAAAKAMVRR